MATDTQRKLTGVSHRRTEPARTQRDVRLFSRLGQVALVIWKAAPSFSKDPRTLAKPIVRAI